MIIPDEMVLAYVKVKHHMYNSEKHVHVTLAIYDKDKKKWIDVMRDEETNIEVLHWEPIKEPPKPMKWATPLGSYKYRTIYKNWVLDKD